MQITGLLIKNKREWLTETNFNRSLRNLLNEYPNMLVDLVDPTDGITRQYVVEEWPNIYLVSPGMSIDDYFIGFTGTPPVALQTPKSLQSAKVVTYMSPWEQGFVVNKGFYEPLAIDPTTTFFPDIKIQKGTHASEMVTQINKMLFTVNGLVHFPKAHLDAIYLPNGKRRIDEDGYAQYGTIDFSSLGGFTIFPMDDSTLTLVSNSPEKSSVSVQLPEEIGARTPLLVIRGRLYLFDTIFQQTDVDKVVVKLDHINMIQDHATIGLANQGWIDTANVSNDAWFRHTVNGVALLDTYDSGIILVNSINLCLRNKSAHRTELPQGYTYHGVPTGIMFFEDGSIGEYHVSYRAFYGTSVRATRARLTGRLTDTVDRNTMMTVDKSSLTMMSHCPKATFKFIYIL